MKFALDWDGCAEEDQELWKLWTMRAQQRGHQVYIVTMRYPEERLKKGSEITDEWVDLVDGVIFTSRKAKKPYTRAMGLIINVWIDDNPLAVEKDAKEVFGVETPKGVVAARVEDLPAEYRQEALAIQGFSIMVRYVVPTGCEDDISRKIDYVTHIPEITEVDFVDNFTKMSNFRRFSIHDAPMGVFLIAELNSKYGEIQDRVVAEIQGCVAKDLLAFFPAWDAFRYDAITLAGRRKAA